MKRKLVLLFLCLFICLTVYNEGVFAVPDLPKDPNWMVDKDIARAIQGWNQGHFMCEAPRGGYNELTENQKIVNSWGFRARPMQEIKDLLPEPHYKILAQTREWGTFRINETLWDTVKPRGPLWGKYMEQSRKNAGTVYLDEKGWLRNYNYGIPFLELKDDDPRIALKLAWNFIKKYQDNDRQLRMATITRDRKKNGEKFLSVNMRIQMNGRVRPDKYTVDGLYKPNPKKIEFIFCNPYVSPYKMRGVIPICSRFDNPDKSDDLMVYLPKQRRLRRVSSTQRQNKTRSGSDWTLDTIGGFSGNVTHFNWTYMGRKELLIPVVAHSHCYYNPSSSLNGVDQYYQRRNCYVIKASYKKPKNMSDIILYLDPDLFSANYSIACNMKGQDWLIQLITSSRDKNWFYTVYDQFARDVLSGHSTQLLFSYSGGMGYAVEDLALDKVLRVFSTR